MKTIFKLLIVITLTMFTNNAFTQKDYVWCPKEITLSPSNSLFKDKKVQLIINDSRVLSKKVKNKCKGVDVFSAISNTVKSLAPNAKFVDSDSEIKIEIWVQSYSATFTSPMWYANTGLKIKITENGVEKDNKTFTSSEKFFNVGGLATAKNNLNKSYKAVMSEFITYLNSLSF